MSMGGVWNWLRSDLCADFHAHGMKFSPLPKIKHWECEKYLARILVQRMR
jgi:hypothetical protein